VLTVVLAIIECNQQPPPEDARGISKVEAMSSDVGLVLLGIPLEREVTM